MKIGTTICILIVMVSILPYIGAAQPGIIVKIGSPSLSTQNGETIAIYPVIIENQDAGYDTDGDGTIDCCEKTITSVTITQEGWSNSNWQYSFDPDTITMTIPADYGQITTDLTVIVPAGTGDGIYPHKMLVEAAYDLYIPEDNIIIPGFYDSMEPAFNTEISNITTIPEFPTFALPIIIVLGTMYVMKRRR